MPRPAKAKPKPPHAFVIEALAPLNPEIRRMFSGFAVYIGDKSGAPADGSMSVGWKLCLMLREHAKSPQDNGIWLVLADGVDPADPSLRREFPSLRRIELLSGKIGHWLLIPSDGPRFEDEALHACDLLLRRDPRLGRVPASRR